MKTHLSNLEKSTLFAAGVILKKKNIIQRPFQTGFSADVFILNTCSVEKLEMSVLQEKKRG